MNSNFMYCYEIDGYPYAGAVPFKSFRTAKKRHRCDRRRRRCKCRTSRCPNLRCAVLFFVVGYDRRTTLHCNVTRLYSRMAGYRGRQRRRAFLTKVRYRECAALPKFGFSATIRKIKARTSSLRQEGILLDAIRTHPNGQLSSFAPTRPASRFTKKHAGITWSIQTSRPLILTHDASRSRRSCSIVTNSSCATTLSGCQNMLFR